MVSTVSDLPRVHSVHATGSVVHVFGWDFLITAKRCAADGRWPVKYMYIYIITGKCIHVLYMYMFMITRSL